MPPDQDSDLSRWETDGGRPAELELPAAGLEAQWDDAPDEE